MLTTVSFGTATDSCPQVLIAGIVNGHVASKYVYVRVFRGTNHMHERTLLSIGSWVAIGLISWVVAWVIAESIPVFNNLLSLIVRGSICYKIHMLTSMIDCTFWLLVRL